MTGNHGLLIYDTLFGMDEDFETQPQMVDKWGVSDDKKTYTFTLRDGLKFHDGPAVTSADVRRLDPPLGRPRRRRPAPVQARRRHADQGRQDLPDRAQGALWPRARRARQARDQPAVIMRKKDAETDPNQQVTTKVGSGPFMFNEDETKPGKRYVYDKNPNYVPRAEPASGMAGGKVAKVDRVIIENMADEQTAVAALKAGEIDFYEVPPHRPARPARERQEHQARRAEQGRQRRHVPAQLAASALRQGRGAPGHAAPHQAGGHPQGGVRQPEILSVLRRRFSPAARRCRATSTPTGSKAGQNIAKAKELFKKAGYDGRPVVILQATNHLLHEQSGRPAHRPVAEGGRRQCRARRDPTGARS